VVTAADREHLVEQHPVVEIVGALGAELHDEALDLLGQRVPVDVAQVGVEPLEVPDQIGWASILVPRMSSIVRTPPGDWSQHLGELHRGRGREVATQLAVIVDLAAQIDLVTDGVDEVLGGPDRIGALESRMQRDELAAKPQDAPSRSTWRRTLGRSTLTATARPSRSRARCTWATLAAAIGRSSNSAKISARGAPVSAAMGALTFANENAGRRSCRRFSCAMVSGASRSGRAHHLAQLDEGCAQRLHRAPQDPAVPARDRAAPARAAPTQTQEQAQANQPIEQGEHGDEPTDPEDVDRVAESPQAASMAK